jgi:hypothetical protein
MLKRGLERMRGNGGMSEEVAELYRQIKKLKKTVKELKTRTQGTELLQFEGFSVPTHLISLVETEKDETTKKIYYTIYISGHPSHLRIVVEKDIQKLEAWMWHHRAKLNTPLLPTLWNAPNTE